jgi:hypothetical protein
LFISPEKKILFFHIPKTAGSSIRDALKKSCPDHRRTEVNLIHYHTKNDPPRGMHTRNYHTFHADQPNMKKIIDVAGLRVDNYFEFVIVRNPYVRLLSIYNYDIARTTRKYSDFDSFLDLCEDPDYVNPTTPFWYKSQLTWIKNPLSKKFRYYKYEELDKAWAEIQDITNIGLPDLPLINENNVRTLVELKQSYKDRIYNMFRDEFDLLNYEK